jgi:hypothetical protein
VKAFTIETIRRRPVVRRATLIAMSMASDPLVPKIARCICGPVSSTSRSARAVRAGLAKWWLPRSKWSRASLVISTSSGLR